MGVIIYIKKYDISKVKKGEVIDTWYDIIPETFVHGGWVQVLVKEKYYQDLVDKKNFLDNLSDDLIV